MRQCDYNKAYPLCICVIHYISVIVSGWNARAISGVNQFGAEFITEVKSMNLRIHIFSVILLIISINISFAGSTLYTWSGNKRFSECDFSRAAFAKQSNGVVFSGKIETKSGEDTTVGVIETPEIVAPKPFNEIVPSWNSYTPENAYLVVMAKMRIEGKWTRWYQIALYTTTDKPEPKKSYGDSDKLAHCPVDTLIVKDGKRADACKLRFELRSLDGKTYPTLRLIAVNVNDPAGYREDVPSVKSVWGTELDVPYLCQLSVEGGSVWCSPTSTAMVLGYWANKLQRPELTVGILESAKNCKDNRWGGTGNWVFNTAYAAEFKGMQGILDRYSSISQIEQWIARGVPVVVSLNYSRLTRGKSKSQGHLMVIRGFTKEGDPVFNDPFARLEKGEKLRKVFKRGDLEYAWLGPDGNSKGAVYIIHPEGYKW